MFFKEYLKELKLSELKDIFSITQIKNKAVIFEGRFSIEYFSTVKIVLNLKTQKIFIYGKNLEIKDMDTESLCVVGEIVCVSSREVFD